MAFKIETNLIVDGTIEANNGSPNEVLLSDGSTVALSGLTGGTSVINTDDYTTGVTFNTTTGVLEFTRQSGDTYNVDLDGRYLTGFTIPSTYIESGDNISELVNDAGYITGFTIPSTYLESGDNISELVNDSGYITGFTDTNNDDYVSSASFNSSNGELTLTRLSGGTVVVDLDGRYLTGFTIPSTYLESGDNVSELVNDAGYITGFTDTNDNDYVTSGTVTSNTLTLTRLSGGTVDIDVSSLTGGTGGVNTDDYTTGVTFNTSSGLLEFTRQSGDTYNVDLDGRYLTGFTIPSTYLESGDNVSELVNDIGYITGFTDTNNDDYVTSGTVTGSNLQLTRLSGGTVDIDVSSLTGGTGGVNTDDYVTSGLLTGSNLQLTRLSGGTVDVNLSGLTAEINEETIVSTVVEPSVGASYTFDLSSGRVFVFTLTAATTVIVPTISASTAVAFTSIIDGDFTLTLSGETGTATLTPTSDAYVGTVDNRLVFDVYRLSGGTQVANVTLENLT